MYTSNSQDEVTSFFVVNAHIEFRWKEELNWCKGIVFYFVIIFLVWIYRAFHNEDMTLDYFNFIIRRIQNTIYHFAYSKWNINLSRNIVISRRHLPICNISDCSIWKIRVIKTHFLQFRTKIIYCSLFFSMNIIVLKLLKSNIHHNNLSAELEKSFRTSSIINKIKKDSIFEM